MGADTDTKADLTAEQNELLDLRDEVFDLRTANVRLNQEVATLRILVKKYNLSENPPGGMFTWPRSWGFRPQETRVLSALLEAKGDWVSHETVLFVLSKTGSGSSFGTAKATVCTLRRKLREMGFNTPIENRWGLGYRIIEAHAKSITQHDRRLAGDCL